MAYDLTISDTAEGHDNGLLHWSPEADISISWFPTPVRPIYIASPVPASKVEPIVTGKFTSWEPR